MRCDDCDDGLQGKVDALRVELQTAGDRKDKGYVKTKVRFDYRQCTVSADEC